MGERKGNFIIGREIWNASSPKGQKTMDDWKNGVLLVVHHSADNGPRKNVPAEEHKHLRAIQFFHQQVRGWNDVGYNYAIFPSGRVYECRGFEVRGAHVLNHNTDTCGIVMIGDYSKKRPTEKAVLSYHKLVKKLEDDYGVTVNGVVGHGDLMATSCPGEGVRKALHLKKKKA